MRVVDCLGYINRCCGNRWTQLTTYGTCTAVRNALVCLSDGIFSMECTVTRRLWRGCFILWFVGVFTWGDFSEKNFRHVTRRGIANFTLWTAASGRNRGITGAQSGHKERGGPHTQRPTPHVPGTVIGAASHRHPELHGRCRRDEESSTTYMVPVGTFFSALPARSFRF